MAAARKQGFREQIVLDPHAPRDGSGHEPECGLLLFVVNQAEQREHAILGRNPDGAVGDPWLMGDSILHLGDEFIVSS